MQQHQGAHGQSLAVTCQTIQVCLLTAAVPACTAALHGVRHRRFHSPEKGDKYADRAGRSWLAS